MATINTNVNVETKQVYIVYKGMRMTREEYLDYIEGERN